MRKMLINAPARGDLESIDNEQADIIHIIRFFHELQDYANILLRS